MQNRNDFLKEKKVRTKTERFGNWKNWTLTLT